METDPTSLEATYAETVRNFQPMLRLMARLFGFLADAVDAAMPSAIAPASGFVTTQTPQPSTTLTVEIPPTIPTGAFGTVQTPSSAPAPDVPAASSASSGAILGGQ